MSSLSVFGLVASYVALAALLVSLNIASLWAWWVKALAIVVMTGFYVGSYVSVSGMLGWPALAAPPDHFQLISSTIVEPSKRTGDEWRHLSLGPQRSTRKATPSALPAPSRSASTTDWRARSRPPSARSKGAAR